MDQDHEFQTDDLALATTLRLRGFQPLRLVLADRVALWVFPNDGRVGRIVTSYQAGNSLVEPRRYNACLRQTRKDLFAFLRLNGITPAPSNRS
jgi:hypothetical protein